MSEALAAFCAPAAWMNFSGSDLIFIDLSGIEVAPHVRTIFFEN
jgi:hypothetical protein